MNMEARDKYQAALDARDSADSRPVDWVFVSVWIVALVYCFTVLGAIAFALVTLVRVVMRW